MDEETDKLSLSDMERLICSELLDSIENICQELDPIDRTVLEKRAVRAVRNTFREFSNRYQR